MTTLVIKQEAVISTPIAPISVAPAAPAPFQVAITLPPNMPEDRMLKFRTSVANRIREGAAKGEEQTQVIAAITGEQIALAKALTNPEFVRAMTETYTQEMAALHAEVPPEEAAREVASILKNRVMDCQNFIRLLQQTEFLAATRAEVMQPPAPAKPYELSPRKVEETIERMVQSNFPGGAEPAVHVAATARGQEVTHRALAIMFRPSGALCAPLVLALASVWPEANGETYKKIATSWLKARHDPAHSIADGLLPNGAIYQEAMRRAEALQAKKLGAAPTPPATDRPISIPPGLVAQPTNLATAPTMHLGMAAPHKPIMMDNL